MKKIKITFILLLLISFWLKAQDVDLERRDRDISTASDILETLLKKNRFYGKSKKRPFVQGVYKENEGIIFSILGYESHSVIFFNSKTSFKKNGRIIKKQKITNKGVSITYANGKKVKMTIEEYNDSLKAQYFQKIQNLTEEFITNYSELLNGVSANDSIKFIYQATLRPTIYRRSIYRKAQNIAPIEISIAKKDLDTFISDNKKEIKTKIVKNIIKLEENYFQEFVLTYDILQNKMNGYLNTKVPIDFALDEFNYVRGLGVTFWLGNEFYRGRRTSTIYRGNRKSSIKENGIDNPKSTQEAFEKFKEKMTKDIVEYGRTLKNIQNDEFIFVKIPNLNALSNFPNCPKNLEFIISKSMLNEYNQQKLSLEEVMKKVEVKEY